MHAAGICLGTIQARTHVQLALACQQSMIRAQHRLRFTIQHVYAHSGNLGNECADHAASLGTYHLRENDYSFDALQAYCFRIHIKTVRTVISPGGDFLELI